MSDSHNKNRTGIQNGCVWSTGEGREIQWLLVRVSTVARSIQMQDVMIWKKTHSLGRRRKEEAEREPEKEHSWLKFPGLGAVYLRNDPHLADLFNFQEHPKSKKNHHLHTKILHKSSTIWMLVDFITPPLPLDFIPVVVCWCASLISWAPMKGT